MPGCIRGHIFIKRAVSSILVLAKSADLTLADLSMLI
jgi:hypothetical protein